MLLQKKKIDDKIKKMGEVKGIVAGCDKDTYNVGYYNGLEYALALLEEREPEFMMYDGKGGDSNEKEEKKVIVKGGYISKRRKTSE